MLETGSLVSNWVAREVNLLGQLCFAPRAWIATVLSWVCAGPRGFEAAREPEAHQEQAHLWNWGYGCPEVPFASCFRLLELELGSGPRASRGGCVLRRL